MSGLDNTLPGRICMPYEAYAAVLLPWPRLCLAAPLPALRLGGEQVYLPTFLTTTFEIRSTVRGKRLEGESLFPASYPSGRSNSISAMDLGRHRFRTGANDMRHGHSEWVDCQPLTHHAQKMRFHGLCQGPKGGPSDRYSKAWIQTMNP